MQADGKINLQIVLSSEARKALYDKGQLVGDKSRICFEEFEAAYQWMAGQMLGKIAPPPADVDAWPVWAWARKDGTGQVDPNDEEYEDQDLWVLTFEADIDQVVFSDFEDWHCVLNGWYLPDSSVPDEGLKEDEAFCAELEGAGVEWADRPYPEPFWSRVTESWKRIFNVSRDEEYVQATFWVLKANQVIKEEPCKGTVPEFALKCA